MTDVINLEIVMVLAYNLRLKETPFIETHLLGTPLAPECPFQPDLEVIEKVGRKMMG